LSGGAANERSDNPIKRLRIMIATRFMVLERLKTGQICEAH
jgi:hypothetical protein